MDESNLRLGEILIEAGVLRTDQLDNALSLQKNRQLRLGTILLQERFVTEPQLVQALSRRLSIPWVNLFHIDIEDSLLELVPSSVAEEFFLIPIYIRTTGKGERSLYVAMNDPMDASALRFVTASAGMAVKPMIAAPSDISAAIRLYYYNEEELSFQPEPAAKVEPGPAPLTETDRPRDGTRPPPPPIQLKQIEKEQEAQDIHEIEEIEEVEEGEEGEELEEVDETKGAQESMAGEEARNIEEKESELSKTEPQKELHGSNTLDTSNSDVSMANEEQLSRRDIEKHFFGVGGAKPGDRSLTLLDGTTIRFGGASDARADIEKKQLTKQDLIDGLRNAAAGHYMPGLLPSDKWEDYIAAILEVLFRKHLVLFDEFMEALKKR